jgi:hypothetical protein
MPQGPQMVDHGEGDLSTFPSGSMKQCLNETAVPDLPSDQVILGDFLSCNNY